MNLFKITQKDYGVIEIDNTESDIVMITMKEKSELNIIQIERENIPALISELQKSQTKISNKSEVDKSVCDCTHTQACKDCAEEKGIDWSIIKQS